MVNNASTMGFVKEMKYACYHNKDDMGEMKRIKR